MKQLKVFVSSLLVSNFAWGNFCPQASSLGKMWYEQQNWSPITLSPSPQNPNIQIQAFKDNNNQLFIAPIHVTGRYKTTLSLSVNSIYQPQRFLEYCQNSDIYGSILTSAREDEDNKNAFRMELNYLPSPKDSIKDPYALQKFTTDPQGLGVVITLREESLVKKSEAWHFKKVLAGEMAQKISKDLQQQLSHGITGKVVLKMDGLDDLACDLLKGQAQIRFFHSGRMNDAKADVIKEVVASDLWNFYDALANELPKASTKEQRLFSAGASWKQNSSAYTSLSLEPLKVFDLVKQMTDLDAKAPMKPMSEQDMECLALNESEFKMNTFNSLVSLDIETQSITEMLIEKQKNTQEIK